jgi:molecular chaperone GrpE
MPHAIATVLADFRTWLEVVARSGWDAATSASPAEECIDLHTLLGQFLALRHEVNLQTKATRAQQEQNAETLRRLGDALEALQEAPGPTDEAAEPEQELLRPLLKTLVDLYDALALAGREVQRIRQTTLPTLDLLTAAPPAVAPTPLPVAPAPLPAAKLDDGQKSFWHRWFRGATVQQATTDQADEQAATDQPETLELDRQRQEQTKQAVERVRQLFDSMATGYTMSLQRVERALQQHGLEAMSCAGLPFDPEEMEVVEVVSDSGRNGNEVIEEVRRGYRWRGRVFRYAQVRVAKPQ